MRVGYGGWIQEECRLGNDPLQDAGVFPAGGDQVTVVVQEGDVGHVTAVAAVLVTRSPWLGAGEGEQVHFAKVVSRGQQGSIMRPAHGVDVRAVCAIWPDSKGVEAQSAGRSEIGRAHV